MLILSLISKKQIESDQRDMVTHFDLKYSNIQWCDKKENCPILVNKYSIHFSQFNEQIPIEKETILSISVAGDEAQLISSLENAVDRLQQALELRRSKRGEQTKLCIAAALSASGGLILLLL